MCVDHNIVSKLFHQGLKALYSLAPIYFQKLLFFCLGLDPILIQLVLLIMPCMFHPQKMRWLLPPPPSHLEPSYSSLFNLVITSSEEPFLHPIGIPSSLELPS